MLPGFRILLALVVLSFAILIFGFSALALLRTAHQNLASQPTWQPAWGTPVGIANARHDDRPQLSSETQTLALLRVDPPAARPGYGMEGSGVALAPATDVPPAPSRVQEQQHGDATPGSAATEVKSPRPAEKAAVAAANSADRPISPASPEPVAGAGDTTSAQTTTSAPADDAPKPTASNASAASEAPQDAGPPGHVAASEPVAPDPDAAAASAKAAEATSETTNADLAAPKSEPPMKLAALPDATTTSSEGRPQAGSEGAKTLDAAELRAKRRARARLRARRLALAQARAARLAQTQQATANPSFYGSNFSTTQNATNAANSTANVTPFGPPRGAP
jgi:hypothetical protein